MQGPKESGQVNIQPPFEGLPGTSGSSEWCDLPDMDTGPRTGFDEISDGRACDDEEMETYGI